MVFDSWPTHLADPVGLSAGCAFDDVGDTVTCTATTLASGASTSFTVVAPVLSSGSNTATVDGHEADPDRTNNTDSATITPAA